MAIVASREAASDEDLDLGPHANTEDRGSIPRSTTKALAPRRCHLPSDSEKTYNNEGTLILKEMYLGSSSSTQIFTITNP